MFNDPLDFLSIGDITTDAFIHITEARVMCEGKVVTENPEGHCELCLEFPDKVPFDSMTEIAGVGNSPNAAVSAARLGLRSALITNVGGDQNGKNCIKSLRRNRVDARYVAIEKKNFTNYHYALWYQSDRTILIKHHEYKYFLPRLAADPKWMYLSSLGGNSEAYHIEIINYLKKRPKVKLAFQPGTFQIRLGTEKLKELYARTEVFICNLEESQLILNTKETDLAVLLTQIHKLGPAIVLITDGPKGAYMYDGNRAYFMPIYPDPKAPYERTGCGDAFASTFIAAVALGKTALEAFAWAPINSMSVVQHIGAQEGLLSRPALENFLKNAPADYKPSIYNSFLEQHP